MHAGTQPGPQLPLRRVRLRRLVIVLLVPVLAVVALPDRAGAAEPSRHVDVVQVTGWIDPVVVDFLNRSIRDSERGGAEVLVIQLDSPGALISTRALDRLIDRMQDARVPIAVWIGGPGAQALHDAGRLALAAPIVGIAPRGRLEVDGRRLSPREALAADVVQLN